MRRLTMQGADRVDGRPPAGELIVDQDHRTCLFKQACRSQNAMRDGMRMLLGE